MGLYNFQPRFIVPILSGEKTHTIRAPRVRVDKPGNTLHLYTGLRHKGARLLLRAICSRVEEIFLKDAEHFYIDTVQLSRDEMDQLARRDGFPTLKEMLAFWEGRLPFYGHIIHWRQP